MDKNIEIKTDSQFWIGETNFAPIIKAYKKFELFRQNQSTEQEIAGTIQAFKYCFELAWKSMKRLLEERGKIANSPKETFRMAALEGFISDVELWFDFLKKRNLTVHTYNNIEAEKVAAIFPIFSSELSLFFKNIGLQI